MSTLRIVAIGASAGGVETLIKVTRALPADFPAPVCIVLHISPHSTSVLPTLLNRARRLEAVHPKDGDLLQAGHIYVAPPDAHLVIRNGRAHLGKGPRENSSRPAIDPLFRSVAQGYGPGAIGVVLSGALDDGTAGLAAIKARGGIAIVQNPDDALYPSMPQSALDNVAVDHVVSQSELAALLERLVAEPAPRIAAVEDHAMALEDAVAEHGTHDDLPEHTSLGEPSGFACPDCHGVLWEIKESELLRFRCRVGHAYLPESLVAAQSDKLEEALWAAARGLRESAALATRLAARATQHNMLLVAQAHEKRAAEAHERALIIEDLQGTACGGRAAIVLSNRFGGVKDLLEDRVTRRFLNRAPRREDLTADPGADDPTQWNRLCRGLGHVACTEYADANDGRSRAQVGQSPAHARSIERSSRCTPRCS